MAYITVYTVEYYWLQKEWNTAIRSDTDGLQAILLSEISEEGY